MIRVERTAEPQVLQRWTTRWTELLHSARTEKQVERALSKYRHKQIKSALTAMFRGKCAYCESKILHVDYGHIDHFRPKAHPRFRRFAFSWENLFLSCGVCNGPSYKGERFLGANQGGPPVNPCDDAPNDHLSFVFDPVAKLATVVPKTERGRISRDLYGLNRPELREYRSHVVMMLHALARFAANDDQARMLLEEARSAGAEFAAFARAILP